MTIRLKKINLLNIIFVITMGVAFVHQLDSYIIPNYIKYGTGLFWIIVWLMQMKVKKKDLEIISIFISPYLWIGLVSLIFWVFNSHTMIGYSYIGNLIYHICYAMLRAFIVLAILEIFGKKAFDLTFYALIFSEIIILVYVGMMYGYGNLFHYCTSGVLTSVVNGFEWGTPLWHIGWAMEVHDNTFAFGVFLIYFLFCEENLKRKRINILISCLFVYLGMKRIEIIAIIFVAMVILIRKVLKLSLKLTTGVITSIYLLLAYLFVIAMKWFPNVFSALDIYRVALYKFLSSQIQIETLVIGKGFSLINDYLLNYNTTSLLTASHSDLVRMAIELGIVFFTIWIIYYLYQIPKKLMVMMGNEKIAYIAFLSYLFVFITYFIDNTLELFAVQIMCMMVPVGVYKKYIRKENKK